MSFSSSIPDKVLEYPNVSAFISVLDELQNIKTEMISESLRVNNVALLMDKKWLIKKLSELGVSNFPQNFPIEVMQQFLLNADTIFRTRGSKIGLELYCSVLTLGEVIIDDSELYKETYCLLLDSLTQGYLTADTSHEFFTLVDNDEALNPEVPLVVSIKSKFYQNNTIKNYIASTIEEQLGFYNAKVTFNYSDRSEAFYHKLLNKYFI